MRQSSRQELPRRAALGLLAAAPAAAHAGEPPEAAARAALLAFLKAFEDCDLPAMEAAFAQDCVSFDRTLTTATAQPGLTFEPYRRQAGMPAGMRRAAEALPRTAKGPPYQDLTPHDLLVQAGADMAVCTFHLEQPHSFGRRTVVLRKRGGAWKIIHIHASSLDDTPAA